MNEQIAQYLKNIYGPPNYTSPGGIELADLEGFNEAEFLLVIGEVYGTAFLAWWNSKLDIIAAMFAGAVSLDAAVADIMAAYENDGGIGGGPGAGGNG